MTATKTMSALRKRFAAPAWAFLEEVRDKAGHGATRSADAIAMGLWQSRGLELHGFEVKASRADWLRERDDPEKAEAIARLCDRWWLVVADPSIVLDGEVPPSWGLMVLHGRTLRTMKDAPEREPDPLPRTFLATMLRRATAACEHLVPRDELAERVEAEVAARMARAQTGAERELETLRTKAAQLAALTTALGIHDYDCHETRMPNIAAAYAITSGLGRGRGVPWYQRELENAYRGATAAALHAHRALADLAKLDAEAKAARPEGDGE